VATEVELPAKERQLMATEAQIQSFCKQIVREFHPEKIVIFGSYAYGKPNPYSDLDLLVIMKFEGSPLQQAGRIIERIDPPMAVDLIVRTRQQVQERLRQQDGFISGILKRGKVAYEAQHSRVG
jgi:uncharacterized protein